MVLQLSTSTCWVTNMQVPNNLPQALQAASTAALGAYKHNGVPRRSSGRFLGGKEFRQNIYCFSPSFPGSSVGRN